MESEEATALWVLLKESCDLLLIYEKLLPQWVQSLSSIPQNSGFNPSAACDQGHDCCLWMAASGLVSAISTKPQEPAR